MPHPEHAVDPITGSDDGLSLFASVAATPEPARDPRLVPALYIARDVKLVMAMKVRDEDDVLEHNLRYHRAQGVDHFIVTDNGSTDGTPEILRRYEAAGVLTLIQEPSTDDFRDAGALVGDAHGADRGDRARTRTGSCTPTPTSSGRRSTGTLKQALDGIPGRATASCSRRGRSSSPAPTARVRSGSG